MMYDDNGLLTRLISAAHKIYTYDRQKDHQSVSVPARCGFCKEVILLGRCECGVQDIITILTPLLPKELKRG